MPFRLARSTEIDEIRAIERASASRFVGIGMDAIARDEPTASDLLAARIAARAVIVATDDDDRLVAFVMFRPLDRGGYVEQIDVLPSHAGQRLGAALIELVHVRAREQGWDALVLETFAEVPWNAPYYRRLGFEVMADEALSDELRDIRAAHEARGLTAQGARVFMRRPVTP